MSIGFQADKSVVGRLERLGLTVVARNDSTAPVKELRIEINQKAHWNAHGYKASKQRTVAKLIVSGSQLGPVGEGAAERPDRDRGFAAVGQDARAELQELLAAGAGVRHELVVPDNKCCDSLQTDMIRIRHSLDVKLKTSSWVTSPELSMPLTVQRTPPDAGALQVEAAGAGVSLPPMSYVESMPVVSAVLLDAPGNPTPSQIPSSAVKLQLESIKPSAPPQQDLPNHGSDSSDGDSSDSDSNSGSSNCR